MHPRLLQHFTRNALVEFNIKWDIPFRQINNRTSACRKTNNKLDRNSSNDALAAKIEF